MHKYTNLCFFLFLSRPFLFFIYLFIYWQWCILGNSRPSVLCLWFCLCGCSLFIYFCSCFYYYLLLFLGWGSLGDCTLFATFCVYIEDITWPRVDTNFIFECPTRYLTSERSERVRYPVEHEKIKFVSTSGHVIFCLL